MTPIPVVGVVCLKGDRVLLIRRGTEPRLGEWSIPGGRIEPGERAIDAALRELKEETGVDAIVTGLLAVIDGVFPEHDRHYVMIDFSAEWTGGEPVAGDDAAEAAFHPLSAVDDIVAWEETRRVIHAAARKCRGPEFNPGG